MKFTLHISDTRPADDKAATLTLRIVMFEAAAEETFEIRFNGTVLSVSATDAEWKDSQIFSPAKQPASGGKGIYKTHPKQKLLRLDHDVPLDAWKSGPNEVAIRVASDRTVAQIEKIEAHLKYAQGEKETSNQSGEK